jgi:hypothetical protein
MLNLSQASSQPARADSEFGFRRDLLDVSCYEKLTGDLGYPSWGYSGCKGILLGFYGSGEIEDLVKKPVKERIEHVLKHASKMHPQIRTEFETAHCTF